MQEIVELGRLKLSDDDEKRLCEATIEDLEREFQMEPNAADGSGSGGSL